jgi:hypothetical protein
MEAAGYTFGELPRDRRCIGDACAADEECSYAGALCLGGVCTLGCTGSCPDAWGRPITRCARLADEDGGSSRIQVCAQDCASTGCRAGDCVAATSPAGAARQVCWGL